MRIKSETCAQRRERLAQWHEWFAWHPIKAECGTIVWLERVRRKKTIRHVLLPYRDFYEKNYLLIDNDPEINT